MPTPVVTPVVTVARSTVRPRYYVWMALIAIGVVVAGFAPGLIDQAGRTAPLTPMATAHSLVFGAWLLLFLAQTTLVAGGRTHIHRQLGVAGAGLAVVMVVVGYAVAVETGRRGFDLSGDLNVANDPLAFLVFPLGDLLSFTVLVGAALWYRRRPAVHKRLMLLATAGSLMGAPLAHLIGHTPALRDIPGLIVLALTALYAASAVYDKVALGRIHPVSLWGGVLLFVYGNVRAALIAPSEAWHRFAAWLIQ
jgi:hypothetical protein